MFHYGIGLWALLPLLSTVFWVALFVVLALVLARWFSRQNRPMAWYQPAPPPVANQPSALEILRQRYARGEIDATTFDQMRERIEASSPPPQNQ